ncbi:bifunctional DNA primase/polymerase [Okeania sp. KiyG1]|uniref:bifunctional DNA primase/polymerase n=1 Tax=Okeania sp. KiyG1 TaxID=2720165 RepID=UPI00192046E0|nr:bifunctional DNA primase/polymerase [Okeania sp. KiyG1]GFZ92402.1 hypothetical protein CYANOKiyG1_03000 [Okeania sp. KiyG1]
MDWKIFNRHPRASEIAEGLGIIPPNLALTPVREKRPYRSNWQHEEPVSREAITTAITQGQDLVSKKGKPYTAFDSGYGVRLGEISDGLLAIDVDGASAEPILKAICPDLPKSVSWTSGKPGRYQIAFQIPPEYREKLANFTRAVVREWKGLKTDTDELLEFRYNYCQSVLPPSYHPTTGRYSWVNSPADTEVAIAPQPILDVLLELADKEAKATTEAEVKKAERARYLEQRKLERQALPTLSTADSLADILELDILPRLNTEDIYNWSEHQFKKHGPNKLVGYCPQHNGSSGTAFQVNTKDNSWYCHGCQEGGHPVQYRWFLKGEHGTPTGKDFVEIVEELASDAGVELPEWKPQHKSKPITKKQWWDKIGETKAGKSFADWVAGKTRKLFGPLKQSKLKSVTVSTDKKGNLEKNTIKYEPGNLPEFQKWVEMGCPQIIISSSADLPLLTAEAYLNGFRNILWNIYAGGGKSWSVDKLDLSLFGIEPDIEFDEMGNVIDEKYPRIIYLDANYRNPSVAGIERKFIPLPGKHLGLKKDGNRLTALGNPHLIRVKKDEIPDIPPNCPETYTFLETKKKGIQVFSGKDSPICKTCPLLYDKNGDIGCPLILERQRIQEEENYISSSVPGFGKSRRSDILVIEEAEANIVPFETLKVSLTEIQKFVADKVDGASLPDELKLALKAILVPFQKAISSINAENKKYGDSHIDVMAKLPTRSELDRAIFEAYSQMWLTLSLPLKNSDRDKLDKKILKKYSKDCLATSPIIDGQFSLHKQFLLQKPNNLLLESFDLITGSVSHYSYWDTTSQVNYQKILSQKIEKISRPKNTNTTTNAKRSGSDIWGKNEWLYTNEFDEDGDPIVVGCKNQWVIPSLENIRDEVYSWLEKSLSMLSATQTPAEKQMLIQQKVHLNWLSPLLDVFCGNKKISLGITPHKELTFTRPSRHPQQLVKNSAFNIFIDATADEKDLQRLTGLGKPSPEKVSLLTEELAIAEGLLIHWPGTVEDEGYQDLSKNVEVIREELEQAKFEEAGKYILVVEMELPDYSNLTINLITDMGACGTQRRYDSRYANGNRIKFLVQAIADQENKPNSSTLFDFQGHIEQYQDIENIGRLGYHFRDNRASNQSQKDDLLICVGKQTRNLSAMAAQWQATTGQAVVPNRLTGRYGEWVVRQNMNETIQTYARLRANRRQNEGLTIYHVAPFNEMEIAEIQRNYPGATVNVVSSFDVCPQAAPKGEQVKRRLVEAVFSLVKDGEKVTQAKVGEIIGIERTGVGRKGKMLTPGGFKRIEKMCKTVIYSLIDNNKMHICETVVDTEFEESFTFLEIWIPALLQDLRDQAMTAEELAHEVAEVVKIFGRKILDFVSVDTLVGLLSGLLGVMPLEFFERLQLALGPPE